MKLEKTRRRQWKQRDETKDGHKDKRHTRRTKGTTVTKKHRANDKTKKKIEARIRKRDSIDQRKDEDKPMKERDKELKKRQTRRQDAPQKYY